jgi:bifunctional non-homologous end joining protein LigD
VAGSIDKLVQTYGNVQNATLVDAPPPGDYVYELKYDGYRILAFKSGKAVRLVSRRGQDWTSEFRPVADAVANLGPRELVLDGEVVALDERGAPSFQRLQNRQGQVIYVVFDLLAVNGADQRVKPLHERRSGLVKALEKSGPPLAMSAAISGDVTQLLKASCEAGFEGLVGKRAQSAYTPGRTLDWIKVKCEHRQEFAIIGYLPYTGSQRGTVGSLLLAVRDAERFIFCGKVGTGFDLATRVKLGQMLEALNTPKARISDVPKFGGITRYNELGPVCEVKFTEWTDAGHIRHPSYVGLRTDKLPEDCVRELSASYVQRVPRRPTESPVVNEQKHTNRDDAPLILGIRISHSDRQLKPMPLTKLQLARYYEAIGDWMLPHVKGRPLTLVRWSERADAQKGGTYLRHAKAWGPAALRRVHIKEQQKTGEYLLIDDVPGLVGLAQMDILEIHTWNSTDADVERPNRIVFDLDPDPSVDWHAVVDAALTLRDVLRGVGLESWVKTTGGKGLHLVVPIMPKHEWPVCHAATRAIATQVAASDPNHYVASVPKERRKGKILIDYLRNSRGSTSVAAFSTRANSSATVSTPIHWDELTDALKNERFTANAVRERLMGLKTDPWEGYWKANQLLLV